MDIYTALKREKSSFKTFLTSMIFISIILPMALWLTSMTNIFYLIYLGVIEILIVFAIIAKINNYRVEFDYSNNKLNFKLGLSATDSVITCDKVKMVHTSKYDYDLEIIIITENRARRKKMRKVDGVLFKRYPEIEKQFEHMRELNYNKEYYFQVIKRGGLKKYLLLDCIYRNCVKAVYTEESIQNIKISRGQTIV